MAMRCTSEYIAWSRDRQPVRLNSEDVAEERMLRGKSHRATLARARIYGQQLNIFTASATVAPPFASAVWKKLVMETWSEKQAFAE